MRKKDFKDPTKEDLIIGNILPIYLDYKNQEEYRGHAILLESYENTNYKLRYPPEQRVYVRAEIGDGDQYDPHTLIWSWERWKIKFVTGDNENWQTAVKIAYNVTTDNYYYSGYERDNLL